MSSAPPPAARRNRPRPCGPTCGMSFAYMGSKAVRTPAAWRRSCDMAPSGVLLCKTGCHSGKQIFQKTAPPGGYGRSEPPEQAGRPPEERHFTARWTFAPPWREGFRQERARARCCHAAGAGGDGPATGVSRNQRGMMACAPASERRATPRMTESPGMRSRDTNPAWCGSWDQGHDGLGEHAGRKMRPRWIRSGDGPPAG